MLALATAYLHWALGENLAREDNAFLANKIQECRRLLRERPQDASLLVHEVQIEAAASQFIKYYVRLLDRQGRTLLETPGMAGQLPPTTFPEPIKASEVPARGTVRKAAQGEPYLVISAWAPVGPSESETQIVQAALNVAADEALMAGYGRRLLAVAVAGVLFSCLAGVFIARRGLRPLGEIALATERITASQLHERVVANGWPEELASLARSFDRMLDRLEESFNRLSQFSADLAHELRTPINNLRGEAGVALSQVRSPEQYRRTLESSLEEYARLARLIDNLLFLARAEGPTNRITKSAFDARQAVESVREFYEAFSGERGVEIVCEGNGVVEADSVLFRQTVSNLLSNALNHTARGGHILVRVAQHPGGGLEVLVRDTGCGIPAEHLPRIFDRLYRVDPARSQHPDGAGLGLAIVKSIMMLHGGGAEVRSEPGTGTWFTLRFPPASGGAPQS